jgi:zinc carboxypeptidase
MENNIFINTYFENASPLNWQVTETGEVLIDLLYDHERNSPNKAAGHIHFKLYAPQGQRVNIRIKHLMNIWNGQLGSPCTEELPLYYSFDDQIWNHVITQPNKQGDLCFAMAMLEKEVTISRLPPYTLTHLEILKGKVSVSSYGNVKEIGRSVEDRPLWILELAKNKNNPWIFLRARAHPWEPGGNWLIEGIVEDLIQNESKASILDKLNFAFLPIASPDGVARGMTRFNINGFDLNRGFSPATPPDSELFPENYYFLKWIKESQKKGYNFKLALCIHNDNYGNLHIPHGPEAKKHPEYLKNMKRFATLLEEYSMFTEGVEESSSENTLGEGFLAMFGIDAAILELNAIYMAGAQSVPTAALWKEYGVGMLKAFGKY